MFNPRINHDVSNENVFHNDLYVDADDRFELIFTAKSKPSNIYKYIFHIFIKSDFNNNLILLHQGRSWLTALATYGFIYLFFRIILLIFGSVKIKLTVNYISEQ